uniref:Minor capsid protein n=1 Tax=Gokushovirinae environmental samples TaxID=1478972 RepID=A0A2R3UAF0_9VIRU|nr:minor capsid protein [Gokushovirinae environmental samples]
MAFGVDDAVAGGFSLAGGLINNYFAGERQDKQNEFNSAQADKQMRFQDQQRATAYQTATDDMRKAGLNPLLAAGVNTSVPSGAMAAGAPMPNIDIGVDKAVSTSMQHARTKSELELLEYQKDVASKQVRLLVSQGDKNWADAAKTIEETPGATASSKILSNNVAGSINKRLESENERPYLQSELAHKLAPTGKAASDLYKLIPPIKFNFSSAKGGHNNYWDAGGGNTGMATGSNFNSRWNIGGP